MNGENITATIKSKKGFYIGDICYVLSEDLYRGFWGKRHHFREGCFIEPVSGLSFAVAGTKYGDGTYGGSDGNEYPVDAGNIGVIPYELIGKIDGIDSGRFVEGDGEALFNAANGYFQINLPSGEVVTIDTDD